MNEPGESMGQSPRPGNTTLRGKLLMIPLGIATAIAAVVIVAVIFGENFLDDSGLTGAVAGISAAILPNHILGKLKKHALKFYFGLVVLNTLMAALIVDVFAFNPESTAQFLLYLLFLYLPIGAVDYVLLRMTGK